MLCLPPHTAYLSRGSQQRERREVSAGEPSHGTRPMLVWWPGDAVCLCEMHWRAELKNFSAAPPCSVSQKDSGTPQRRMGVSQLFPWKAEPLAASLRSLRGAETSRHWAFITNNWERDSEELVQASWNCLSKQGVRRQQLFPPVPTLCWQSAAMSPQGMVCRCILRAQE